MRKVLIFSLLLMAGLVASQVLPGLMGGGLGAYKLVVQLATMVMLGFIMIHVGYEFDIDRRNMGQYGVDAAVASSAASLPWLFCAVYFIIMLGGPGAGREFDAWKEALVAGCFAAPTSAGVLFSMLAAAGLGATWLFRKARVLAIFDDLFTVLLLIPLKAMVVGPKWQLGVILLVIVALLWLAWKKLHSVRWPITWGYTLVYSVLIVAASEAIYFASKKLDPSGSIHIEVLLPAFVLGCIIARQERHGHDVLHDPGEQRVGTIVSAFFMVLVGLSMPLVIGAAKGGDDGELPPGYFATHSPTMGWGEVALHVLAVTVISNLGKMLPAFCYRSEAGTRERLALAVGMWPRGEVGAGVLVIALSFGITGPILTVAMLSLALNLVLTGGFIVLVKRLLGPVQAVPSGH
jgi:Kef-type K+ transport system membrane component KefB